MELIISNAIKIDLNSISTKALMEELIRREAVSARRAEPHQKYSIKTTYEDNGRRQTIETESTGPCMIIEVWD